MEHLNEVSLGIRGAIAGTDMDHPLVVIPAVVV